MPDTRRKIGPMAGERTRNPPVLHPVGRGTMVGQALRRMGARWQLSPFVDSRPVLTMRLMFSPGLCVDLQYACHISRWPTPGEVRVPPPPPYLCGALVRWQGKRKSDRNEIMSRPHVAQATGVGSQSAELRPSPQDGLKLGPGQMLGIALCAWLCLRAHLTLPACPTSMPPG
jgi:hypothetical protein